MASSTKNAMEASGMMYEVGALGDQSAASCPGGNHECLGGLLAVADRTPLHDEKLIEATRKINHILKEAGEHRKDRELALINIGGGALLIWAQRELPDGFTAVRSLEEIRRLLRVKTPAHISHSKTPSNQTDS